MRWICAAHVFPLSSRGENRSGPPRSTITAFRPSLWKKLLIARTLELSILSAPQPIRPEEIEIGRHGLLISQHGRRGLLLPQVPAERGWDCTAFLEQTCRKAGLPLDAWQKGATLEAFTAEVFRDKTVISGQ